MSDWGIGRYEATAADLEPASQHTLRVLAPRAGERVLDVGAGTGNAALVAARMGARVTALDPAPRLLEVAATRAAAAGLELEVVPGEAGELPFADGTFDAAVSVFAVIFAPDARRAVGELLRVTRPDGRVAITSWVAGGALERALRGLREEVERVAGPAPDPGVVWADPAAVAAFVARLGAEDVATDRGEVPFVRPSAFDYLDEMSRLNPMGMRLRGVLAAAGTWDEHAARAVAELEAGNEAADGFRVCAAFAVTSFRRPGGAS